MRYMNSITHPMVYFLTGIVSSEYISPPFCHIHVYITPKGASYSLFPMACRGGGMGTVFPQKKFPKTYSVLEINI